MDSMFPWYSLLNMKIIWLYMVSARAIPQPIIMGNWIWKFAKILWGWNFFLHLWGIKLYGKGGVKNIWGVIFITTVSLFHFFRNTQHPEKWNENLFRTCECISCYLPISSNLLKESFRKTLPFVLFVEGVMEKKVFC